MTRLLAVVLASSLAAAADQPIRVVQAPDSPVRLDKLKVFSSDDAPSVLLYAATNVTDNELEQFTVTVFVFDQDGRLKARQVAPGRRTLEARETKFSAMVLDVGAIAPTDSLMAGVDQAQRVGSEDWWRVDLRALAEQAATAGTGAR
jgi:hypothetical protein